MIYTCPPFSFIQRVLSKMERDQATGLLLYHTGQLQYGTHRCYEHTAQLQYGTHRCYEYTGQLQYGTHRCYEYTGQLQYGTHRCYDCSSRNQRCFPVERECLRCSTRVQFIHFTGHLNFWLLFSQGSHQGPRSSRRNFEHHLRIMEKLH